MRLLVWLHAQGINESTNFSFLQRLSITFGFHQDSPWSLASCRDYRPRKMASCEAVHVILLPAETLGRKLNHTDSLCRKLFAKHNSLGRELKIAESLDGSQIWQTVSAESVIQRTRLYPVACVLLVYSSITLHFLTLRSDFTSKLVPELAFGTPKILHCALR